SSSACPKAPAASTTPTPTYSTPASRTETGSAGPFRRVRLPLRARGVERRQFQAGRLDPLQGREPRHVHPEAARVVDLRYQAAVGEGRGVAFAEGAGRRMVGDHRLGGDEALHDPVLHPFV